MKDAHNPKFDCSRCEDRARIPWIIPKIDETSQRLFGTRGILPFHDFTEGPDWWEADDYRVCFSQMVKMRMNLMGLHCYPEGPAGPEPLVWVGHLDDLDAKGMVSFSPPSRWASTTYNSWGYCARDSGREALRAPRLRLQGPQYRTDRGPAPCPSAGEDFPSKRTMNIAGKWQRPKRQESNK